MERVFTVERPFRVKLDDGIALTALAKAYIAKLEEAINSPESVALFERLYVAEINHKSQIMGAVQVDESLWLGSKIL